jgi:DNA-binding YbaB/EbfC family protein
MEFNIEDMMKKVQELQSRMGEAQEKLKALETTAEVGGGMVSVTINGKQEIKSIKIEKSVVNPADVEMLEDLVLSCVNKAIEQSLKMAQDEMGKSTSGMLPNIPGLDPRNFGM